VDEVWTRSLLERIYWDPGKVIGQEKKQKTMLGAGKKFGSNVALSPHQTGNKNPIVGWTGGFQNEGGSKQGGKFGKGVPQTIKGGGSLDWEAG